MLNNLRQNIQMKLIQILGLVTPKPLNYATYGNPKKNLLIPFVFFSSCMPAKEKYVYRFTFI
jgi:hypothetical protein